MTDAVVSTLRRVIVWIIVVAFAAAAIGGIVVLLGGELGEAATKVLATTGAVGLYSVAVLCCASLLGRRVRVFGLIGVAVSVLSLGYTIWFIWAQPGSFDDGLRVLGTAAVSTTAFALASLLLLLVDRRRAAVRWGLWITLGLSAITLVLAIVLIWRQDAGDTVPRVFGIVAILAALGAVVVPVISLLLPDAGARGTAAAPIDDDVARRLVATAARRGITVEELVAPVLDPSDAVGR